MTYEQLEAMSNDELNALVAKHRNGALLDYCGDLNAAWALEREAPAMRVTMDGGLCKVEFYDIYAVFDDTITRVYGQLDEVARTVVRAWLEWRMGCL